jgi:hypothetical protein
LHDKRECLKTALKKRQGNQLKKGWKREDVRKEFERRGIEGNVTIGKLSTLAEEEAERMKKSGIEIVSGRGRKKTPELRSFEKLRICLPDGKVMKKS